LAAVKLRFRPDCLGPLPWFQPDYRDTAEALVHKDTRLRFGANRPCVPARYIGFRLTVKAHFSSVAVYDREREIVLYPRSWRRGQTFGAERFEKDPAGAAPPQPISPVVSNAWPRNAVNANLYLREPARSDRSPSFRLLRSIARVHRFPLLPCY
jgi:hypothetical protein